MKKEDKWDGFLIVLTLHKLCQDLYFLKTFLPSIDYFDKTGLSPMACHVTVWPAVVFSVPKTATTDRSVSCVVLPG